MLKATQEELKDNNPPNIEVIIDDKSSSCED
jgi:hypothetical protein